MASSSSNSISRMNKTNGSKRPSLNQDSQPKGNEIVSKNDRNNSASTKSISRFRPGRGGFGGVKLKAPMSGVRYTAKPIVPAEKAELISVAKAMHRENFGKRVQETFSPEVAAAVRAVETGHYVGWRCPECTWDCIRVGEESKCFCGHLLNQHRYFNGTKSQVSCAIHDCRCRSFEFVPSRPEDVGEFWLKKRPGYDPSTWTAKCRCKHSHTNHSPIGVRRCQFKGCRCHQFESNFLCAACDRHWEDHQTFFETEDIRVANGLPIGEAYIPFAELSELRDMALTGDAKNSKSYLAIKETQSPFALQQNFNDLSLQTTSPTHSNSGRITNETPVHFGYQRPKGSPFD
uniref:protein FAM221B-like isoform X2 n=1 Tax=Styela clava TaxID=7725 RepID=UPI00193AA097|nr:protein FAM221B-like isoform X2 [Styela clava]